MMEVIFKRCGMLISKKRFTKEAVKYRRRVQRVFATDSSGSSAELTYIFVLVSGDEEKGGGLCIEKVLLSIKRSVIGCNESQKYVFL